jgi:hypothetical protein
MDSNTNGYSIFRAQHLFRGAMAYNFETGNNKIKLLTEYESVSQKVLFWI